MKLVGTVGLDVKGREGLISGCVNKDDMHEFGPHSPTTTNWSRICLTVRRDRLYDDLDVNIDSIVGYNAHLR